ncbi:MAG: DNA polymerase III subunit beta [Acidobacteriota bacterium]
MELTLDRGSFLAELQFVQGVVERRTTVPILANVLLETEGNSLLITGTDLDVTLRCRCAADVRVSGSFAVSARKLFDIVRLLAEEEVHVKVVSSEWLEVACGRSRFKIAGMSGDSFPAVPPVEGPTFEIPAIALRSMIPRCSYAITQEDTRYTLNGALLRLEKGLLTLVATDGHRMSLVEYAAVFPGALEPVEVLVPKKTLQELGKLVAETAEPVRFGRTENHLFFEAEGRLLVSRILTGRFPNYRLVIPRDNPYVARVPTGEFVEALRRVAVMTDDETRGVKLDFSEGYLDLTATSADYGEAEEGLPIQYEGPPLGVAFRVDYLLDFLVTVPTPEVAIFLKDREAQVLLKPVEEDELRYSYVIMPMKA